MKLVLATICVAILSFHANAQKTWNYNFNDLRPAVFIASADAKSFLTPVADGGGTFTAYLTGEAGDGAIEIITPGLAGGTGAELKLTAGAKGVAKLGLSGISDATTAMAVKFNARFEGKSGRLTFALGDDKGNFSGNTSVPVKQGFAVLNFNYSYANKNIELKNLHDSKWELVEAMPALDVNKNYVFEIYANNSAEGLKYTRGKVHKLAKNSYDLWVNGELVLTKEVTTNLPAGKNLNALMLSGFSSANNTVKLYVDDLVYTNALPTKDLK